MKLPLGSVKKIKKQTARDTSIRQNRRVQMKKKSMISLESTYVAYDLRQLPQRQAILLV